jgi:transposase-like protein
MKRPRRNHTAAYKAKVALAALKGDKTLAELSEKYDVRAAFMKRPVRRQNPPRALRVPVHLFSSPAGIAFRPQPSGPEA